VTTFPELGHVVTVARAYFHNLLKSFPLDLGTDSSELYVSQVIIDDSGLYVRQLDCM